MPARSAVVPSSEWISVAGKTSRSAIAKSALAAANACARRIRLTTRVAGSFAIAMKDVLQRTMIPIAPGPTRACAFANGGRMFENSV